MNAEPGQAKEHRTVSRVVRILELVAAAPTPMGLSALADSLAAPKTSVHGLVKGLAATGYLRELDGSYVLGPAVSMLLGAAEHPMSEAARAALDVLRLRFDETVLLSVQVGMSVVYVEMIESSQFIRYTAPLGQRRPIYPTSTGKCFLAHMAPARRDACLAEFVPDPAEAMRARAELEQVRAEGVAYNRGETVPDVSAAASVVLVPGRSPIALAVVGPTTRVAPRLGEISDAVRTTAQQITRQVARTQRGAANS